MPGAQIYVDIITSYPKVKAIIVISIPKTASNLRRPAIDIKNNIKEVNWWKKEVCYFLYWEQKLWQCLYECLG